MPDRLTSFVPSTFLPYVGTAFLASVDGTPVALTLVDVARGPEQPGAPRPEPFTLVFTGAPGAGLAQATYPVSHEVLGAFELFLVPRQPLADGLPRWDAVFN